MGWPLTKEARPAIDAADRWFVLLNGEPVAMLSNPHDADMFWFTWDVHSIGQGYVSADLWQYSNDERRSFRHVDTDELDPYAFPGGTGLLDSGRVLIRGPLRGRAAHPEIAS
jgi:hypothetical protein